MDKFIKSVNNMNSTVLVPSKLRDMDVATGKNSDSYMTIPPCLRNADLYTFYSMLNEVKHELLGDPSNMSTLNCITSPSTTNDHLSRESKSTPSAFNGAYNKDIMNRACKHTRQPSDDSLGSLGSIISSDLETDSETDSLLADRDSTSGEHTAHLAAVFKHHLQSLHTILHQFADAADYLSVRYQQEIDSSS